MRRKLDAHLVVTTYKCFACSVKEAHSMPGIVAHAFESSTREADRQAYLCEFETSVVYMVSSSTANAA